MKLFKLLAVAILLIATNVANAQCVSPTFDGYTYDVVEIGEQCWFAENLRTTTFANGDSIGEWLHVIGDFPEAEEEAAATVVYGQDSEGEAPEYVQFLCSPVNYGNPCNEAYSLEEFGRLYNWLAVSDSRNICPVGWHVPSAEEWNQLDSFVYNEILDGTIVADGVAHALKSSTAWFLPQYEQGTDNYGFNAKPGGWMYPQGYGWQFESANEFGSWWFTSTQDSNSGYVEGRHMNYSNDLLLPSSSLHHRGAYVRCINSNLLSGCTDVTACNYDPEAELNDGSCEYPQFGYDCACNQLCYGDFNNDGIVTTSDLLVFLGAFGLPCPQ